MLEKFTSWALGDEASLPFVFVQVQPAAAGSPLMDAAIPLASALLGGAMAFIASRRATNKEIDHQRERDAKEREHQRERDNKEQAAKAKNGFMKLVGWTNLIEDIDLHVKNALKASQDAGLISNEISDMVGPSVGRLFEPDPLNTEEFSFLLTEQDVSIVNELHLVVQRAGNLHSLLERYSVESLEFVAWVTSLPGVDTEVSGPLAESSIPNEYKSQFEIKVGHRNKMIGHIVEMVDADKALAYKVSKDFSKAARAHFGDAFPPIDLGQAATVNTTSDGTGRPTATAQD